MQRMLISSGTPGSRLWATRARSAPVTWFYVAERPPPPRRVVSRAWRPYAQQCNAAQHSSALERAGARLHDVVRTRIFVLTSRIGSRLAARTASSSATLGRCDDDRGHRLIDSRCWWRSRPRRRSPASALKERA